MPKKALSLALWFILLSFPIFAEESVTITTYYPSPYGIYNYLQAADKFGVGDTDGDGKVDSADLTVINPGEAGFALGLYLKPQAGDPTNWALAPAGRVRFSAMNAAPYYSNGSTWVKQGGGGGGEPCYQINYNQSMPPTPPCPAPWNHDVIYLGQWGFCVTIDPGPPQVTTGITYYAPNYNTGGGGGSMHCPNSAGVWDEPMGTSFMCCRCTDC